MNLGCFYHSAHKNDLEHRFIEVLTRPLNIGVTISSFEALRVGVSHKYYCDYKGSKSGTINNRLLETPDFTGLNC